MFPSFVRDRSEVWKFPTKRFSRKWSFSNFYYSVNLETCSKNFSEVVCTVLKCRSCTFNARAVSDIFVRILFSCHCSEDVSTNDNFLSSFQFLCLFQIIDDRGISVSMFDTPIGIFEGLFGIFRWSDT